MSSNNDTKEEFFSLFTEFDIHLFKAGNHYELYKKLGSHLVQVDGVDGCYFAVWAPSAKSVSVIGNYNDWAIGESALSPRWDGSGIWEGFIEGVAHGEAYKYAIETQEGYMLEKGDPFARYWEEPPKTASIVWDTEYKWSDKRWLNKRMKEKDDNKAYSVYEIHMGSWRRNMVEGGRSLTYMELAEELVEYVKYMNYTHVEFLPVMEHPFYGSWGYQITGYFAPTSRYGDPQQFKYLVNALHKAGIGVILDWVPSHFPNDDHGLYKFDGTHLYEHADPRKGFHPDWQSSIFNYGRFEVKSILISNAMFWIEEYHIDGLRVDAVASMLYLDYSRNPGEWIPNEFGGNENIEAIRFLKEMNENVYANFPDVITIAEESTAWSGVSRPTYLGGLGFGQKWMMGWMHDTLEYFKRDTVHRKWHQNEITFSIMYAFTENFMLPFSHDEVVHGKGALMDRMPGDEWQRFANMRLMLGYMIAHPGTKLQFMGTEMAQTTEWKHDESLSWHLLEHGYHLGVQNLVRDLNWIYRNTPALYDKAFDKEGFEWIDYSDGENSVVAFARFGDSAEDMLVVICNFTPMLHYTYRVGVPKAGTWKEIFNSDDKVYSGTGLTNGTLETTTTAYHGKNQSIVAKLPPLGICIFALEK